MHKKTRSTYIALWLVALRSRPKGRDGGPQQAGGVSQGTRRVVEWLWSGSAVADRGC